MFRYANVTVMVSDLERAVQFYTRTLGLSLKNRYGNEFAEVEAPGLTIGLHPSIEHGPSPGRSESLSIGLGVEDLDKAMNELRNRGVQFLPNVIEDGALRIAYFTDPDNNLLYLAQMRQWPSQIATVTITAAKTVLISKPMNSILIIVW